ncbi:MAG: hypothetical protein WBC18_13290 [Ottowia sp.]|uniref:hypothetical protein n=1 Tax=Ottowia sp. TaxID=1898956 RepID=UPI003C708512
MLDITALREIRPFVATPSHSGLLTSGYTRSLLALSNAAWTHGFPMMARFLDGEALVTRARNELVAEFMADTRFTHLFWIDDDIGFEVEAALRLLLAGKDVVAGACPKKTDGWPAGGLAQALPAGTTQDDFQARYAAFNVVPFSQPQSVDTGGFVRVQEVGCGFMLIARRVFEAMAERYAHLRYVDTSPGANPVWSRFRFFDTGTDPDTGAYLSEDFAFCRRWRAAGGEVWVDTQSDLAHRGTKIYRGRFAHALTEK